MNNMIFVKHIEFKVELMNLNLLLHLLHRETELLESNLEI